MRFSVRVMLVLVFLAGVGFTLWNQHRRLEIAYSVLEANGLRWNLEPLDSDSYRIHVRKILDNSRVQVREVTILTDDVPSITLPQSASKSNHIHVDEAASKSEDGQLWRTQFTIVAYKDQISDSSIKYMEILDVKVQFQSNNSTGSRVLASTMAPNAEIKPVQISDNLDIQITSGDYPRGKPIDILKVEFGATQPEVIQLNVK